MERTFGLDSALKFDSDIYHIETFAEPKQFKVISLLYKSGKVLELKEKAYDHEIKEKSLIALIQSIHRTQIDEVSHLLNLAENVKKRMHGEAFNKIGMLLMNKGFLANAKISFEEAIKLDHNLTDAHRNLGQVYQKSGDIDKAIAQYTRALYLAPDNPDYYLDLGLAYLEKGMYDEAFKELEKAININKDFAEAYFNLGLLILKEKVVKKQPPEEKDVISAMVNLKYASLLDPRFQAKSFKDASILIEEEEYSEALETFLQFKESLKKINIHEFVSDFEIFSRFSDLKEIPLTVDEYIDRMSMKVEQYPAYADLRNALGKAYLIKMRTLFNAALTQFKKAIEINPEYEHAKKNLELVENEAKGFMLFLRAILK
jgi:tetratricopeptide (TPR) repeat protein